MSQEPTTEEIERHLWKKIDELQTKEELEKLIEEVNEKAKDNKEQILQKAELKKQVMGWTDQKS